MNTSEEKWRLECKAVRDAQRRVPDFPRGCVRSCAQDPPDVVVGSACGVEVTELIVPETRRRWGSLDRALRPKIEEIVERHRHDNIILRWWPIPEWFEILDEIGSDSELRAQIEAACEEVFNRTFARFQAGGRAEIGNDTDPDWRISRHDGQPVKIQLLPSDACSVARRYNPAFSDPPLTESILRALIEKKVSDVCSALSKGRLVNFDSLLLLISGAFFPRGGSESGDLSVYASKRCHPCMDAQYAIAPFDAVYVVEKHRAGKISANNGRLIRLRFSP